MFPNLPVIAPVVALLRSRKVMVALACLLTFALIGVAPGLAAHQESIQVALLVFGSALIGAIAWEDGQEKRGLGIEDALTLVRDGPATPAEAGKDILFAAADEIFHDGA